MGPLEDNQVGPRSSHVSPMLVHEVMIWRRWFAGDQFSQRNVKGRGLSVNTCCLVTIFSCREDANLNEIKANDSLLTF